MSFHATSHAKWILTGEHAVLRQQPAIVFPKNDMHVHLSYAPDCPPTLQFSPANKAIEMGLKTLLDELLTIKNLPPLQGAIVLQNTIPIGKGWGFSAAVSCVIAKLLIHLGCDHDLYTLAKEIEDHFHGKSSGLDIIGCMHDTPVLFHQGETQIIDAKINPLIEFIDSGPAALSSECIQRVTAHLQTHPEAGQKIDAQMGQATHLAHQALISGNIDDLGQAIRLAADCFAKWDLINEAMARKIKIAYENGAIACKPSGAGLGGLMLALKYPESHK